MRKRKKPKQFVPPTLSIVTQFYPPDYAATGQLIEELAIQLESEGIAVSVFTSQPSYAFQKSSAPPFEKVRELQVKRSRTSRIWSKRIRGKAINGLIFCLRSALHLLKNSRQQSVLLFTTAPPYLPILGYLSHLLFKTPYVCLLYDLYPDIAIELNVVSPQSWLIQCWHNLNRQVWKHSAGVIVLSSTMKDKITVKCPEVEHKIAVIHSWANPNWIIPIPKEKNWFAHQYGLTKKFTVLYSGNMGRCHDMDTILAAAAQLKDAPIQFVFIGDGAKRRDCLKQVQALQLNNCRFLPYQDKQFLPYSLTACDLSLVSISRNMEGLVAPSKLYGSLAAGRPVAVICEPHSYLRSLIAEAGCGATFEQGDANGLAQFIRHLSTDAQLVDRMGNAGRHYLQTHFTLEVIAQQYAEVICPQRRSPQALPAPYSAYR